MGIDPVTHKPKNDALLSSDGQSKSAAKLSHMAQWESARLEAEARLVRESKLRSHSFHQGGNSSPSGFTTPASAFAVSGQLLTKTPGVGGDHLESPTSTLTFSESAPPIMAGCNMRENSKQQMIEFVGTSDPEGRNNMIKEEGEQDWTKNSMPNLGEFKEGIGNTLSFTSTNFHDISMSMSLEAPWTGHDSPIRASTSGHGGSLENEIEAEGFTNLLFNSSCEQSISEGGGGSGGDSENGGESGCSGSGSGSGSDYYEDNKNYWNSILNLVNSSPSGSPLF
ncbi:hypothetical protein CRG98_040648 [Punica granatum]|nr:hypothetical protein CRG98_040648 [Punica granatum]